MSAALTSRLVLTEGPPGTDTACLTFDDGPHPEHTPPLLDRLRDRGVRATFFLVGQNVQQYPQLVQRIADEGHVIGNHTWSHAAPETISPGMFAAEIRRTQGILSTLIGSDARLFRPPKKRLTFGKLQAVWREGLSIVLWNRFPGDDGLRSPREVQTWLERHPVRPGHLVLLHDGNPHTAAMLPKLVDRAVDDGVKFGTPLDWIDSHGKIEA